MKKNYLRKIMITGFLFGFSQTCFSQTSSNKNVSGDEQGLETSYHFQLEQDKQAVEEAVNGWWKESMKNHDKRMSWFNDAKFGCFVHWGVYSSAAGEWDGKVVPGYAEHLMRKEIIPLHIYKEKLVATFNPVDFDADEWMSNAKAAGMKYFIITAKHHDGFAMYFSDAYPYDMRLTEFNKDPMMELKKAAEKYDIKFGFYYSHAFDWEHPDAPGNDWDYDNPGGGKLLHGKDWWLNYPEFLEKAHSYVEEKSIPQIKELITKYHPDIIWFDTPHKLPLFENVRILNAIRETDPNVIVNGRLVRFDDTNLGDYKNTGDRAAYFYSVEGEWESIPTTNESYGYSKYDKSHKSIGHFVRLLASAAARGGNILMNVGPMGNGKWDDTDVRIFKGVGDWLRVNGESIYGTGKSPLAVQAWGEATIKNESVYLHVFKWPKDGKLIVGGLKSNVKKAYLLSDKYMNKLPINRLNQNDITIEVPSIAPDSMNSVVVLTLEDTIVIEKTRLLSSEFANKLMTFDSELHGDGFTYGDGKPNREYVSGWNSNKQWLSWGFRLNEPAEFSIALSYVTAGDKDSGNVIVEIDNEKFPIKYAWEKDNTGSTKIEIGTRKFSEGDHTIKLLPVNFMGEEFMRPLYITLLPKKLKL